MLIKARVVDAVTGQSVPYVNISLVTSDGQIARFPIPASDEDGIFGIDPNWINDSPEYLIQLSSAGYKTMKVPIQDLDSDILLVRDEKSLGGVTVKGIISKLKDKNSMLLPAILATASLTCVGIFFYKTYA